MAAALTSPFEKTGRERPEEISRAVLFLLSEEESFITSVAFHVDGGYLLKGWGASDSVGLQGGGGVIFAVLWHVTIPSH